MIQHEVLRDLFQQGGAIVTRPDLRRGAPEGQIGRRQPPVRDRGAPQPRAAPAGHEQPVPQHLPMPARERRSAGAVEGQDLRHTDEPRPRLRQTLPEIPVLAGAQRGVEAARGEDGLALHQHGVDRCAGPVRERPLRCRGDVGPPGRRPEPAVRHDAAYPQ